MSFGKPLELLELSIVQQLPSYPGLGTRVASR